MMFDSAFRKIVTAAIAAGAGMGVALAEEPTGAAPSWQGFYAGVYAGVTHGLSTRLETTADAKEKRTVGWCKKENKEGKIGRFPNDGSEAECEGTTKAVWQDASCPAGVLEATGPSKGQCRITDLIPREVTDPTCSGSGIFQNGQCVTTSTTSTAPTQVCPAGFDPATASTCTRTFNNNNQATNQNNGCAALGGTLNSPTGTVCTINKIQQCSVGTLQNGQCVSTSTSTAPPICPSGASFQPTGNPDIKDKCLKPEQPPTYVDNAVAAFCEVDSKKDGTINSQAQCEALNKNNDNGPKAEWVEKEFSFLQDLTTARSVVDDETNFTAGIIGGYNFQNGRTVFGIEADIGQVNESHAMRSSAHDAIDSDMAAIEYIDDINESLPGNPENCAKPGASENDNNGGQILCPGEFGLHANSPTSLLTSASADMGLSSLGTLRGRLGRTFDEGRVLAFITGGVAFGKISTRGSVTYSGTLDDGDPGTDDSFSETRRFGGENWELGWTAGAGVNYMIGDQAILGLTYLYTDLGTHEVKDSFSIADDGSNASWFGEGDSSSVSGTVKGKVDARFHAVRASFTVLFQ